MADAFLDYLTIFRSRLGSMNIALDVTGLNHQPDAAVLRRLKSVLDNKVEISLEKSNQHVIQYLVDKKFLGREVKSKSRYSNARVTMSDDDLAVINKSGSRLQTFSVFTVDTWLADPAIPSTVGSPTANNASEVLDMAYQLRLIRKTKNTWTAAGHMINQLREKLAPDRLSANPFLLGTSSPAFLRQVLEADGLMLREILRQLIGQESDVISRDGLGEMFPEVVARVVDELHDRNFSLPDIRQAKKFLDLIERTSARREDMSSAPGVLEHRITPRLEWLTDLGYLSKPNGRKNGFEYRVHPSASRLLSLLDERLGTNNWSDSVAVEEWFNNPAWREIRAGVPAEGDADVRFVMAYRLLRRRIGPSPLRDVAFVTCLLSPAPAVRDDVYNDLLAFARNTPGVSLSAGRYGREPENIYMSEAAARGGGPFEDQR